MQRVVDGLTDLPTHVHDGRLDILYANRLGQALYAPLVAGERAPGNVARFVFLDPAATEFFADWDGIADDAVAILRAEAGRDPHDRRLTDLIGELYPCSELFRIRWAAHDVKLHRTGTKTLHHPVVGDPGQTMLVYSAEPASPSAEALNLLGSWAGTPARPATSARPDGR